LTRAKPVRFISRAGFDVIREETLTVDALPTVEEYTEGATFDDFRGTCSTVRCIIAVDLSPWHNAQSTKSRRARVNHRVRKRAPQVRFDLKRAQQLHSVPLAVTTSIAASSRVIRRLFPRSEEEIAEERRRRVRAMQPPACVTVEHQYEGFDTNGVVHRVRYKGRRAILRLFRPGRERFARNERKVLSLHGRLRGLPRMLAHGPNWVLTDFFPNAQPLNDCRDAYGKLPLAPARRAFDICEAIHQEGFALLDFLPANVLVDAQGQVRLIDFEWVHQLTRPQPFDTGPTVQGYANRRDVLGPNGPDKSYRADWEEAIGFPYATFRERPIHELRARRKIRVTCERAGGALHRRLRWARRGWAHYQRGQDPLVYSR